MTQSHKMIVPKAAHFRSARDIISRAQPRCYTLTADVIWIDSFRWLLMALPTSFSFPGATLLAAEFVAFLRHKIAMVP